LKDGKEMQRQNEKTSLQRIRHPKALIENGKPRLRHNRAIEFGGIGSMLPLRCKGREGVQRTACLV
jgi:hypothetical protein